MSLTPDYTWLITSTTYGTWLPGDKRGFVGPTRNREGEQEIKNQFGAECDRDMPRLKAWATAQLKCAPIRFTLEQADEALAQFQETCSYRQWRLLAASVMTNHFHALVSAPPEVDSEKILGDLKSYASRRLNQHWKKPASGTWWTQSGSRRRKDSDEQIVAAVRYVFNQPGWLVRYANPVVPTQWLAPNA